MILQRYLVFLYFAVLNIAKVLLFMKVGGKERSPIEMALGDFAMINYRDHDIRIK